MGGGHWTADEGLGGRGHSTDGSFLLFRVAWLSQAKTCPEARPACTDSSAAQTEGWTFVFGSPPRRMEGALDGAMMASIVALDRDGDSTDDAETCDGGDARRAANYGAVVIFG